ncbi:MAG TPA: NAD-glutamate dehydrogenase [Gaiellaceae bacterium]|nr:NAD-glutamate dehydrogenase [Gaiellaceae bacterium]
MPGNRVEAKATLIEEAVAQVEARLPAAEAPAAEAFLRQYYADAAPEDLAELDLYGAALAHWQLAQRRRPGEPKIHAYTPSADEHGWQSPHSVVEIVTDDMPFLVDSVAMAVTRHGSAIHLYVHPVLRVRRDEEGRLLEVLPKGTPRGEGTAESLIHVEIDRHADPDMLAELAEDLRRALADVAAAVEDWPAMRARVREIVDELEQRPPPIDAEELSEAAALLEWLHDDHFTFLGYREYELETREGEDVLCTVPGSGLGILREKERKAVSHSFAQLPPEVRSLARAPHLLNLTKANSRATVHRPSYLDYVGVKRFDENGAVVAERRFLGLYTSTAYSASPWQIPVLRRKVERVLERSGFVPVSHDYKALVEILESYPRDELFQIAEDELYETAIGILHLGERRRVRLFVRRDTFGRFLSCLVYLPLERYDTQARRRILQILLETFGGVSVDYTARVTESVLVRLHVIIYTAPGSAPRYDPAEIEAQIVAATRTWRDDLHDALVAQTGEGRGTALFERYGDALPAAYREDFTANAAVADIERIEQLDPSGDLDLSLYLPLESSAGHLAFKLLRSGTPLLLSDVLPLLENMGVKVTDERPFEVTPAGGAPVWIYDFGLAYGEEAELETDSLRTVFQEAFAETWGGNAENDAFNRLVLRAGLTWREIALLRAISKYLRQAGSTFSQTYMEDSLAAHPGIAARLVELFRLRFDPARSATAEARADLAVQEIEAALDDVASLDQDRILRSFLSVIQAMLRTNYFQTGEDGRSKPYLSFKLDPAGIPDLPAPRPMFEIFVYSPRMEGVHLRGGRVARGGIRWSDRREDFRTEVLGLMKAQTVKNAVIVPVGAKGGFVVKQPPADRDALRDEVISCYRTLIRGLLDVTDTRSAGGVVPPPDVVRYDEDDPYLVVAADKGTATFSDIANALSLEYGFWLGDAFASGGSAGYDHKKMGITARGAWESVKRHFRELGVDVATAELTVVGIGDMSGDVFGNGMLLSRHLKLVGAFDHRHVFVDPDPDPARSFEERARLFALPGSSWADYDPGSISAGGGVYPRTAKSIEVSPEARRALGIEAGALTPNELIRALLRAPVDLLWNGGIGTFVKARAETHAEVGDRASDAIRVDAEELRCRVVGEGGNLGLTHRARIAYALAGGRVYMDAIDNSAGVDCSDHEVNIKILLDAIVADGDLTEKQRNELLAEMTDEVAALVLRDNYEQTQAISVAVTQASSMVDVHARYLRSLEVAGSLDRALEFLPDDEVLAERKAAGLGLTAPELAILLSYTKIALYEEVLDSDLPDEEAFSGELERYFPRPLRARFSLQLERHPLRREIVAARLTNGLVNRAGTSFVFRLREETGATGPDVVRAFVAAREIFDLQGLWAEIEALDGLVPARTQLAMFLKVRVLLERATRWLLRNRPRPLDVAGTTARFRPGAEALQEALPGLLPAEARVASERVANWFADAGAPAALARRIAHVEALVPTLDLVELASAEGLGLDEVAAVYFTLGDRLELYVLEDRIAALPREERWDALARRALGEDLQNERRALTADVLRQSADGAAAAERVDAWLARNPAPVERYLQILAEAKAGSAFDLATISVGVREIRNLIAASVPTLDGVPGPAEPEIKPAPVSKNA